MVGWEKRRCAHGQPPAPPDNPGPTASHRPGGPGDRVPGLKRPPGPVFFLHPPRHGHPVPLFPAGPDVGRKPAGRRGVRGTMPPPPGRGPPPGSSRRDQTSSGRRPVCPRPEADSARKPTGCSCPAPADSGDDPRRRVLLPAGGLLRSLQRGGDPPCPEGGMIAPFPGRRGTPARSWIGPGGLPPLPPPRRDAAYYFHTSQRVRAAGRAAGGKGLRGGPGLLLPRRRRRDFPDVPDCVLLAGFDQLMLGYEKKEGGGLPQGIRRSFNRSGIVRPASCRRAGRRPRTVSGDLGRHPRPRPRQGEKSRAGGPPLVQPWSRRLGK